MARRLLGAVAAVAIAGMLAGCSLVEGGGRVWELVQGNVEAQAPLRQAVTELRALPGVEQAHYEYVPTGENGEVASLHVAASRGAGGAELGDIAQLSARALEAEILSGANRTAELAVGDAVFTQHVFAFAASALRAEVEYWVEIRDVLDAPLVVALADGGAHGHQRMISAPDDAAASAITEPFLANYSRLLDVAVPPASSSVWMLPGILLGSMPAPEVIALVRDIQQSVPLSDFRTYDPSRPEVGVEGLSVRTGPFDPFANIQIAHNERRADDWPRVLAAGAATAAVSATAFTYIAKDDVARFFRGECETGVDVISADRELVAAIELAEERELGIIPGMCRYGPPTAAEGE